jgi:hypothetical protein
MGSKQSRPDALPFNNLPFAIFFARANEHLMVQIPL